VQPDVLVFGICIFVSSTISRVDESLFQSDGLKRYYNVSKSLSAKKQKSKLVHIEQVIGLAKHKILILALNRTEAKLASDISF
jgi:hypothetical protein